MIQKLLILLVTFSFMLSVTAGSQEDLRCLIISEILTPKIIDDSTIELKMRDGKTLQLKLNRACPQLSYHQSFSYLALRGEVCINRVGITTRAGETCSISSIIEAR